MTKNSEKRQKQTQKRAKNTFWGLILIKNAGNAEL